ncbi:hypothetical protein BWQ96_04312 [Gracilariopsis chorda]|uniref:Uncharacterized protein n=1 Tax=Gracilariopsis chorda TaxID=448386 RepID=A0A2V3IVY9_9FLOR|nr:hypothetical protein BWQ96_04312 [Gracilariopsis chorda]|eukprot:PXF45877.1 hypothetical protein BWQ96_04312 [Gracilariopsis chorda]
MKIYNAGNQKKLQEINIWDSTCERNPLYKSLSEWASEIPEICFSTFGEPNSWCLDILTIANNAIRFELNDMYEMHRAMALLKQQLTFHDVKLATLWFRTMWKFMTRNLLQWHGDVLLPWVESRVSKTPSSNETITTLKRRRGMLEIMSNAACSIQSLVSRNVSTEADGLLVQCNLAKCIKNVNELGERVLEYLRNCEVLLAPLLIGAGVSQEEKDRVIQDLLLNILQTGRESMEIPILLSWMPILTKKAFIKSFLKDSKLRPISLAKYNEWQESEFEARHRDIVRWMGNRARGLQ